MRTDIAGLFDENNYPGYAEKVAQVESDVYYFVKQADEEGYDLDGFTDDQIVEMASEWGDAQREGGVDGYDSEYIEGPENLGPKTAEADFLGRYMAHAMHDEQIKIAGEPDIPNLTPYAPLTEGVSKSRARKAAEEAIEKSRAGGTGLVRRGTSAVAKIPGEGLLSRVGRWAGKNKNILIPAGAAAAGLGAGVAGTKLLSGEKKSHLEALDQLATDYANELIQLSPNYHITFDKVASVNRSEMDRLIAELAWAKLEEAGYVG